MTRPDKSRRKLDSNPGSSAPEADALTTRPARRAGLHETSCASQDPHVTTSITQHLSGNQPCYPGQPRYQLCYSGPPCATQHLSGNQPCYPGLRCRETKAITWNVRTGGHVHKFPTKHYRLNEHKSKTTGLREPGQ